MKHHISICAGKSASDNRSDDTTNKAKQGKQVDKTEVKDENGINVLQFYNLCSDVNRKSKRVLGRRLRLSECLYYLR